MGNLLSTPSTNPSESKQSIDMSSSKPSQNLESKPDEGIPKPKSPEIQTPIHISDQPAVEEMGTLEEGQGQINLEKYQEGEALESKPDEGSPKPKSPETQTPIHVSDQPAVEEKGILEEGQGQINLEKDQEGENEDEEEGECGFCLFMKGGGCRDSFTAWENCVEEAEKNKEDIVEKCFAVTGMLKKCMEAHSDYYGPILQAEKAAEEEAVKELEREKGKEAAVSSSGQSEQNSAEKGSG